MTYIQIKQKQGGYSLVEMAIALMIIGLLVAPIFALYQKYLVIQAQETTQRNITAVIESINAYRFAYGQFPCPAPINVGPGETGYGISTDCSNVGEIGTTTPPNNWDANFGYSVISAAQRDGAVNIFDSQGNNVQANASGLDDNIRVRRGAIPFVELGLSEETALDGYGNKIVYAVTEQLADPVFMATYNATTGLDPSFLGAINVEDENNRSLIFDQDTANTTTPLTQYVVFSQGPDAQGAYRRDGVQIGGCPALQAQTSNCNLTLAEATFSNVAINTSGGAGQNDDVFRYYNRSQNVDAWQLSATNANDIHLKPQVPAAQQFLDIGTVGAQDSISEVQGAVLVEDVPGDAVVEGMFISTQLGNNICDDDGSDCINLNALMQPDIPTAQAASGAGESILCNDPALPFMNGVGNNDERCTNAFEVTCPPGSFILGFDNDGRPNCESLPCREATVQVCGDDVIIPERDRGAVIWTADVAGVRGESRSVRYRCNNDAEWEIDASISANDDIFDDGNRGDGVEGVCVCNPVDASVPIGCPDTWRDKYTNNGATRRTRTTDNSLCSREVTDTVSTHCACKEHTVTRSPKCALGDGRYERERERGCNPDAYWKTDWTITDSSSCGCSETESPTTPCKSYETGPGITQEYSVNCVTGAKTPVGTPTGSCQCNDDATREHRDPCPSGEIGTGANPGIVYNEEYDCGSNVWVRDATPTEYNCEPIPSGTYIWVTTGSSVDVDSRAGRPVAGDNCTIEGDNDVCMISASGVAARACRCLANPD